MAIAQSLSALFYFLAVDTRIKFGITTDWERRYRRYQKRHRRVCCKTIQDRAL